MYILFLEILFNRIFTIFLFVQIDIIFSMVFGSNYLICILNFFPDKYFMLVSEVIGFYFLKGFLFFFINFLLIFYYIVFFLDIVSIFIFFCVKAFITEDFTYKIEKFKFSGVFGIFFIYLFLLNIEFLTLNVWLQYTYNNHMCDLLFLLWFLLTIFVFSMFQTVNTLWYSYCSTNLYSTDLLNAFITEQKTVYFYLILFLLTIFFFQYWFVTVFSFWVSKRLFSFSVFDIPYLTFLYLFYYTSWITIGMLYVNSTKRFKLTNVNCLSYSLDLSYFFRYGYISVVLFNFKKKLNPKRTGRKKKNE